MQPALPRRDFLRQALAATVAPLVGGSAVLRVGSHLARGADTNSLTADPAGLTTYQLGPQIWVRWDNRLITCYRAHRSQKYPYLYPLSGPASGLSLTAETCLPYPHHRSMFFACDRVNGGNYWQEGYEQGQILSSGPALGTSTKQSVEITDACEWQKPGGPVVMRDQRRIRVSVANEKLYFVDWDIAWTAAIDVTIQKNNHSLFALRAAEDIVPVRGGTLANAEGDQGEKATFGKKSPWCAFYGRRAGGSSAPIEGIALFDHPTNPWSPAPWFTRDYGFLSPTPFNFIDQPWTLGANKSVQLRYRAALFVGSPAEAELARHYREWTA